MQKRKVLVACPPFAFATLERVLGAHVDLMFVNRLATARAQLVAHDDIAMVVCGVHFDESRMFNLLQYAHDDRPEVPFLCVRVLEQEGGRMSADAIATAAKALGAVDYVDLVAMTREHGRDVAESRLSSLLLRHLPDRRGSA